AQRDFAVGQLENLTRRGRQLSDALAANPDAAPSLAAARAWQQAAAAAIHQLSGGNKAHWLSRAFSGALLIRSAEAGAVIEADWSFGARIAAAEREGLIRGGCARLPPVARTYRDLTDAEGKFRSDVSVSERDARVTTQVLHVVMRDLDPGR